MCLFHISIVSSLRVIRYHSQLCLGGMFKVPRSFIGSPIPSRYSLHFLSRQFSPAGLSTWRSGHARSTSSYSNARYLGPKLWGSCHHWQILGICQRAQTLGRSPSYHDQSRSTHSDQFWPPIFWLIYHGYLMLDIPWLVLLKVVTIAYLWGWLITVGLPPLLTLLFSVCSLTFSLRYYSSSVIFVQHRRAFRSL